ncbi:MAG: hypothetical protein WBM50_18305 [Acidimicrobiales bacterium]
MDLTVPYSLQVAALGRSPHDRRIDLDELLGVTEEVHAEQGRRRHIHLEPVSDGIPSIEQVLMFAHDVDGQLTEVVDGEAMHFEQPLEIFQAGDGLSLYLTDTDDLPVTVQWDLSGDEKSVPVRLRVPVARGGSKTGRNFVIVHEPGR